MMSEVYSCGAEATKSSYQLRPGLQQQRERGCHYTMARVVTWDVDAWV